MMKKYRIWIYVCLIILFFSSLFICFRKRIVFTSDDKLFVELNSSYDKYLVSACYGNFFRCESIDVVSDWDIDTSKTGVYTVKFSAQYLNHKKDVYLDVYVVDREKPLIEVYGDYVSICPNSDDYDILYKSYDNYDGDLTDRVVVQKSYDRATLIVHDNSFNINVKNISIMREDLLEPEIALIGNSEVSVPINSDFVDPGVVVTDNCDVDISDNVKVLNSVDTSKIGNYDISYTVSDSSGNQSSIIRHVNVYQPQTFSNKVIYLTFDDGPSQYTGELLDVLNKYNVKVTFFVTGRNSKYNHFITRAYNEGHSIGLHTNTHNYSEIYKSVDAYLADLNLISEKVKELTGSYSYLLRFPGGSSNTVSKFNPGIMTKLTELVELKGYSYFDWNVSSGDADGKMLSPDNYVNNVINGVDGRQLSVVLQHDTNVNSVRAVEKIIQYGLSNGYRFESLNNTSPSVHHRIFN